MNSRVSMRACSFECSVAVSKRDNRRMAIAHARGTTAANLYRFDIRVRDHALIADEPAAAGGQDEGPTAVEMVAAALSACTATTLRMYAGRKSWDLQNVDVAVDVDWREMKVSRVITLHGALDDEQRARLMQIADACPVHKLLAGSVAVTTTAAAV
jgi:putative redox protein